MKTLLRSLFQPFVVLFLVVGQPSIAAWPKAPESGFSPAVYSDTPAQAVQPLASLLRPDGSLDLHAGFSGSLDPTGWSLVSGPGEAPRFARAGSSNLLAVSGDELWDRRFNLLGFPFPGGLVRAIAVSGNDVYVGGEFTQAGTTAVNHIARWNSVEGKWYPLGTAAANGTNGAVYAIAIFSTSTYSYIYVGGSFSSAGNVTAHNIARWNTANNTWSAVGVGMDNTVRALAVNPQGIVYAGGDFRDVEGPNSQYVAAYASGHWTALGTGVSGPVYAIALGGTPKGTIVYVGGNFLDAGGKPKTEFIAAWAAGMWQPMGNGLSNIVYALAVSGSTLYAGGDFGNAGGVANTHNFARWYNNAWLSVGTGVSGTVRSITPVGNDVYIGGEFLSAGGVNNTGKIARWNGVTNQWVALGSSAGGPVYALAQGLDGLYTGGLFSRLGNTSSLNIGIWHGSVARPEDTNWDGRFGSGAGLDGRVCAIAVSGSDVYVGGDFSTAGSVPARRIARWDGKVWSALGGGITVDSGQVCDVRGIAVVEPYVYVGGAFTSAGGALYTNNIARWNTATKQWSPLAGGIRSGSVDAVVNDGGNVYVAGTIGSICLVQTPTCTSSLTVNNVARWNGSGWFALGSGLNGRTVALAASGGVLYAVGDFTKAGVITTNHVARWDGTNWSALGSGTGAGLGTGSGVTPDGIAVNGANVYVTGTFTTAGGSTANHVAWWNGTSWSAMGSGLNRNLPDWPAGAIAVAGGQVFVGGPFTTAGGKSASGIAKWEYKGGTGTWSSLGSGLIPVNPFVNAITLANDSVYVGGNFNWAGAKSSDYFAIWHTALPHNGTISGRVLDPNDRPVAGAVVQACLGVQRECAWVGTSNAYGSYLATGLPAGDYLLFAETGSGLRSGRPSARTLSEGGTLIGQDIHLMKPYITNATVIEPVEGYNGERPIVGWLKSLRLYATGCLEGAAGYEVLQNETVVRGGSLTENPTSSGKYEGTIDPLHPYYGSVSIRITITCQNIPPQVGDFPFDIQPGSAVRTVAGVPIENATVTLYAFDETAGDFVIVPNQDAVMSTANRANPDLTNAGGYFGWDVQTGYYKIRVEKAGCVSPYNLAQPYVESDIFVVPPPLADLDLRLSCNLTYLPLVSR